MSIGLGRQSPIVDKAFEIHEFSWKQSGRIVGHDNPA